MTTQVELKKAIHLPNGDLRAVDYSGTINQIPYQWNLIRQLGLFGERFGTQKEFFIAKKTEVDVPLLEDRNWEGTRPTLAREAQSGVTFLIPHFPVDDMILPNDIDGRFTLSELGAGTELDTVARVRADKIDRIRRTHEQVWEYARGVALVTGDVYAPMGTLKTTYGNTVNSYQEWGITRQTHAIRVGTGVDPQESVAELFGKLQSASYTGDALSGYMVICSPELFNGLVQNDYIRDIYAAAQLPGAQQLLVGRLGNALGLDARFRSFEYAGILFVEYRGTVAGQRVIPANQGVAMPRMQVGRLHFAPANKFGANGVNDTALASYLWEYMGQRMDKLELESETNFAAVLDRPDLVMTVTMDTSPATP